MLKMVLARKKLLIFIILQFGFSISLFSLEEKSLVSYWAVVFSKEVPSSLVKEIERQLKNLPTKKPAEWEINEYITFSRKNDTYERLLTKKNQLKDSLPFEEHPQKSQKEIYQLNFDLIFQKHQKKDIPKIPTWIPLNFKVITSSEKTDKNYNKWLSQDFPSCYGLIYITAEIQRKPQIIWIKTSLITQENSNPHTQESIFNLKEDIKTISYSVIDKMAKDILGYSWASITPQLEPKDSLLKIDQTLINPNHPRLLFWPFFQKPITITFLSTGFETITKSIILKENEVYKEKISLKPLQKFPLKINSIPSEASIYVDNLFIGTTPQLIQDITPDNFITLQKKGYVAYTFQSKQDNLLPAFINLKSLLEQENDFAQLQSYRNRFYVSLATLILSFIPTFINLSLDMNAQRLNQMGKPSYRDLTQCLVWGSLTLNLSALLWNITESILYLKQAEKTSLKRK